MAYPVGETLNTIIIDENGDTIIELDKPIEKLKEWPEACDLNGDPIVESSHTSAAEDEQADVTSSPAHPSEESNPKVQFQVSSSLLKNSSQYFRNILSGRFNESLISPTDGKYHIGAQGFHPKAMEHVLDIVHVRTRRIPKMVELEVLVHIAVLVDYYDLKETVWFHGEIWSKAVAKKKFSETSGRDVVLLTFVAKTFGDDKSFKRGAELIVRHSKEAIPDLGFPMFGLDESLEELRQNAIQLLVININELKQELLDQEIGCSEACKSMLLGTFVSGTRSIRFSGRTFDTMERPYHGVSFEVLSERLMGCSHPPAWFIRKSLDRFKMDVCNLDRFVTLAIKASKAYIRERLEKLAK